VDGGASPGHDHDIHGTALAGVIGAVAGNGEGIVGVAPDSKLVVLKACRQEKRNAPAAICDTLTLAKALNKAITLMPDVVNLSLTGPYDPLLIQLVQEAIARGIVVVASDPGGENPQNRAFPASVERVIRVHAAAVQPPDDLACGELDGSQICAPSADVLTTFPNAAYNFLSGSSIAAAHVSGVIALLLELNPTLTVTEVTEILRPVDEDVAPRLVNACTVIEKIRSVNCGNAPTVNPESPAFPLKVSYAP
jgi:subtilisin family serine protease